MANLPAGRDTSTGQNWQSLISPLARGTGAVSAGILAAGADWRAGYLILVSEVSTTYFQ